MRWQLYHSVYILYVLLQEHAAENGGNENSNEVKRFTFGKADVDSVIDCHINVIQAYLPEWLFKFMSLETLKTISFLKSFKE